MAKHRSPDKVPELSMSDMNRILNNVYASCQIEPSKVSLESVIAYTKYRQERFNIQKTIALIAFVLFLLVPFLFIAPKFTVTKTSSYSENTKVQYSVSLNTIAPVRTVTADINGYNLPVTDNGDHTYNVQPTDNGTLTVTVTLFNGQKNEETVEVTGIDENPPELVSYSNDNDHFYLYVKDEGLGINYAGIYAAAADGSKIYPESYDTATGEIIFAYPDENINVIIPDIAGNKLQLVVYKKQSSNA